MAVHQTNHVIDFVKVRRGGERFWAQVLNRSTAGIKARCDSPTADPLAPRYGEEFDILPDEEIIETLRAAPSLRVVR